MPWPRTEQALARAALLAWLVCFALSLGDIIGQTAWSPLQVSRAADAETFPRITRLRYGQEARAAEVRIGDQLLEVGGLDLRGAGPIQVGVGFSQFRGADVQVPARVERAGEELEVTIVAASRRQLWPRLVASVFFAAAALFLLVRATPAVLARNLLWGYLAAAFFFACVFSGGPLETWVSVGVHVVSLAAALVLNLRTAFLFPAGRLPQSGLLRALPWLFGALVLADTSRFYEIPWPRDTGAAITGFGGLAYFAVALGALTHNYRVATALEQRRMRWFVLGAYCVAAPLLLASLAAAFEPRLDVLPVIALSLAGLLPVFMLIGILRCNFLDVDGVISATASYSLLLALLLALILLAAPALGTALAASTGLDAELARAGVSVALAVLAIRLHAGTKARLDGVFFADRVELDQALEHLILQLGTCTEPAEMTRVAGEGLDTLFQPLGCVIHARTGDGFVPVFQSGVAATSRFAEDAPLVATLGRTSEPIATEALGVDETPAAMEPFDLAVLRKLGVPIVVPVRHQGRLLAFVSLGRKRSGDVYTRTDRALLAIAADKISSELSRFDQGQLLRAAHASQQRLRRFVPGSLAEELEQGDLPEIGRARVSVLFVDLRGYTSFAEPLAPEQVFETINEYTGAVSRVVREHGGTVVEFNGDGMMAVFGAPQPLENTAAPATNAARSIAESVPQLTTASSPLSVGVGVATGMAFVGSVQAVDRSIWTALGDTTNLAARLQAMTRDLGSPVLLDDATWQGADQRQEDWERHDDVAIRGRRRSEALHALRPL